MAMDIKSSGQHHSRSCPNCGATVGTNANFCGSCAMSLVNKSVNTWTGKGLIVAGIALAVILVIATLVFTIVYFGARDGNSSPVHSAAAAQPSEQAPSPAEPELTVSATEAQRRWEALPPLEREAYEAAMEFLKVTYYQCGEDFFVRYVCGKCKNPRDKRPKYVQIHEFRWKIKGAEILYLPLTEADRLNGITRPYRTSDGFGQKYIGEWEGDILVEGSAYREFAYLHDPPPPNPTLHFGPGPFPSPPPAPTPGPGEWLPWRNVDEPLSIESYKITKFEGRWMIGAARQTNARDVTTVDCGQIPQASLKVSQVPDPTPPPIKNSSSPVPATVVGDPMLVPSDTRASPKPPVRPKATPEESP